MKTTARYLAIFLFFFLCIFGGADTNNIVYLLAVLGIAILGIATIIILVILDYRRHPPITTADLIEEINWEYHRELIKSAHRT